MPLTYPDGSKHCGETVHQTTLSQVTSFQEHSIGFVSIFALSYVLVGEGGGGDGTGDPHGIVVLLYLNHQSMAIHYIGHSNRL